RCRRARSCARRRSPGSGWPSSPRARSRASCGRGASWRCSTARCATPRRASTWSPRTSATSRRACARSSITWPRGSAPRGGASADHLRHDDDGAIGRRRRHVAGRVPGARAMDRDRPIAGELHVDLLVVARRGGEARAVELRHLLERVGGGVERERDVAGAPRSDDVLRAQSPRPRVDRRPPPPRPPEAPFPAPPRPPPPPPPPPPLPPPPPPPHP